MSIRLSDMHSNELLRDLGAQIADTWPAFSPGEAVERAQWIGFPCVIIDYQESQRRSKTMRDAHQVQTWATSLLAQGIGHLQENSPVLYLQKYHAYIGIYQARFQMNFEIGQAVLSVQQTHPVDKESKQLSHTLDLKRPFFDFEARELALALGMRGPALGAFTSLITQAYRWFCLLDILTLTLDPIFWTKNQQIVCSNSAVVFDECSLFRQKRMTELLSWHYSKISWTEKKGIYPLDHGVITLVSNAKHLAWMTCDSLKKAGLSVKQYGFPEWPQEKSPYHTDEIMTVEEKSQSDYEAWNSLFVSLAQCQQTRVFFVNLYHEYASIDGALQALRDLMQNKNTSDLFRKPWILHTSGLTQGFKSRYTENLSPSMMIATTLQEAIHMLQDLIVEA